MAEPIRSESDRRGHLDTLGTGNDPALECQPQSQIVWWEEVEEATKVIFEHRPSKAGLQFAWHIVIHQGYAQYANERERVGVLLRFVTLVFLWQTSQLPQHDTDIFPLDEYSFAWVTKLLGLSPSRLGWVTGFMNIALPGANSDSTEFELTTQMLPCLVDQIRPEIVEILQQHFGGTEGLSAFFSQPFTSCGWDRDDREKTGENFPGEAQRQREDMQQWVEQGCPFPANLLL